MVRSAQRQVRGREFVQSSLFFLVCRVFFVMTFLQFRVSQAGNRHASHSYAATSPMPANATPTKGFGSCEPRSALHAGSRKILHVSQPGFVHGGCEQSVQRVARKPFGNSQLHLLRLKAWQIRSRHSWQRNDSASEATAFSLRCFC